MLPFPTKLKAMQAGKGPGAPEGNSNNESAVPRKARADTPEGSTDPRDAGDQAERGENQDNGGNND